MERETDFFHLFTQHQFLIFVVGSLVIMALSFVLGVKVSRRSERRRDEKEK